MNDPLTEIYFWSQVIGDSKRTVICSPDLESRVKGWVEARAMGGIITVQAERFVPDDQIFIIDTPALDAHLQESLQQSIRDWRPVFPPVAAWDIKRDFMDPNFLRGIDLT